MCRVADIKYGALAEVEEALKRKQAEARRSDRMLSDTVGPEEIATVVSKWTGIPVNKLQVGWLGQELQLSGVVLRHAWMEGYCQGTPAAGWANHVPCLLRKKNLLACCALAAAGLRPRAAGAP